MHRHRRYHLLPPAIFHQFIRTGARRIPSPNTHNEVKNQQQSSDAVNRWITLLRSTCLGIFSSPSCRELPWKLPHKPSYLSDRKHLDIWVESHSKAITHYILYTFDNATCMVFQCIPLLLFAPWKQSLFLPQIVRRSLKTWWWEGVPSVYKNLLKVDVRLWWVFHIIGVDFFFFIACFRQLI